MTRIGEDLTIGQLRTFVCVARAGSFVKAADSLGISQPSVSEQVNILEERLGYLLFYRRRGTTPVLTPRGREVLEKADHIIESIDGLVEETKPLAPKAITVNVSIGPRLRDRYLKPLLPRIYREHPLIQIDSQPLIPFTEVGRALQTGEIDLAAYSVSMAARGWMKGLTPIGDVRTVLVAPPGTSRDLAAGRKALADYQFLFTGDRNVVSPWVDQVFAELGITPKQHAIFFQDAEVVLQLVADGQGVSVLMHETCMESVRAGLVELVNCRPPRLQRIIGRSPHASGAARIVESYLRQALRASCEEAVRSTAC